MLHRACGCAMDAAGKEATFTTVLSMAERTECADR